MKSDKIQKAELGLLLDQPFFGTLLLNLKQVQAPGIQTMATDGTSLLIDPAIVQAEDQYCLATMLAHEVLHCALLHHLRRDNRDPKLWNQACDYEINDTLQTCNDTAKAAGKPEPFPWPKSVGHLFDPQFKGQSAEEIYGALASKQPKPDGEPDQDGSNSSEDGDGSDSNGMGGVMDAPGDESSQQAQKAAWKQAMTQAAQAGKMAGNLPANLKRLVQETLNPPARWQDLLRAFIREACRDDYSWTRPNPRYAATGFMLPSLYSQRLGPIVVAIDTSGSIDGELLNTFLGEVEGLMHECRPSKVTLIDCDTQVNSCQDFEPADSLPREFNGGGGTSFEPVFEHVQATGLEPVCLIYFTDLEGSFPKEQPAFLVLWASYNTEKQAPFGQTIKLR